MNRGWQWDRLAMSLLGAGAGFAALLAWTTLSDDHAHLIRALAIVAPVLAVVGWLGPVLVRPRWAGNIVAIAGQLVVAVIAIVHQSTGHWLPTVRAIKATWGVLADGAFVGQTVANPVPAGNPEYVALLFAAGLGILLATDVLLNVSDSAALAGVPLLVAVSVGAALLLNGMNALAFALSATFWLTMLALEQRERLRHWGRWRPADAASDHHQPGLLDRHDGADDETHGFFNGLTAQIGLIALMVALILAAPIATTGRDLTGFREHKKPTATDIDPMLNLKRDLVRGKDIPMLSVAPFLTYAQKEWVPSYVRVAVLDRLTASAWSPSPQNSTNTTSVGGDGTTPMPDLPGVDDWSKGPDQTAQVTMFERFRSRWVPAPGPLLQIGTDLPVRINPTTFAVTSPTPLNGQTYYTISYQPKVNGPKLLAAGPPPNDILLPMTTTPQTLPAVFGSTARQVTQRATNDFDRAILLQRWFQSPRFKYSLARAPGNGMETLQKFITTDRVGYCEQFSTAMAIMARTLGIPARVVVGFLYPDSSELYPGSTTDSSGAKNYVFGSHDVHAWPELYFQGMGWVRFEPTPQSRTIGVPSYTRHLIAPLAKKVTTPTSGASNPVTVPTRRPDLPVPTGTGTAPAQTLSWRPFAVLGGLVVVGLILLTPRMIRRQRRRRRFGRARTMPDFAEAAWSEVRDSAVDLGLPWDEDASVRRNGNALAALPGLSVTGRQALGEVVRLVELTRYARPGSADAVADRVRDVENQVTTWRHEAVVDANAQQRRRAKWWPGSVMRRRRR